MDLTLNFLPDAGGADRRERKLASPPNPLSPQGEGRPDTQGGEANWMSASG